jgi:hypothetical protein
VPYHTVVRLLSFVTLVGQLFRYRFTYGSKYQCWSLRSVYREPLYGPMSFTLTLLGPNARTWVSMKVTAVEVKMALVAPLANRMINSS